MRSNVGWGPFKQLKRELLKSIHPVKSYALTYLKKLSQKSIRVKLRPSPKFFLGSKTGNPNIKYNDTREFRIYNRLIKEVRVEGDKRNVISSRVCVKLALLNIDGSYNKAEALSSIRSAYLLVLPIMQSVFRVAVRGRGLAGRTGPRQGVRCRALSSLVAK